MTRTVTSCLAASLLIGGMVSCRGPQTVAPNIGKAKSELMRRQVQNPEASEDRNPVIGMGGTTAADVVRNYHENQRTEAQQRRQDRARDNGLNEIE